MALVRLQNLSFQHSDAQPLFEDVELVLGPGWTGLVGPNGAGKSTLLQLIAGTLRPLTGRVRLEPEHARVCVCAQEVEEKNGDIEAFAWASDGLSRRLQGRLRLDPEALERWDTLSPGERKRWQIGAALSLEPELLLLDEPTNHLDAEGRALLLEALSHYSGLGLVVSHDRALLDALTTRTIKVDAGRVELWNAPYGVARGEWERARQGLFDARQRAQDELKKKKRQLDAARRQQEAAERSRSTGRRMKDRNDSDARGILAQTKADWADAAHAQRRAAQRRKAEEASETLAGLVLDKTLGRSVFARYEPAPQPFLALREAGPLRQGDTVLAELPTLSWGRGDKVHLAGRNGIGKTTLLLSLLEHLRVPRERLLVLMQSPPRSELDAALERVHALSSEARGELMSLVAALGVDPARLLGTPHPSPGEARKLLLAEGLVRGVWGLVLDEPTNHLDLPSIERLEAALVAYPGALLIVSHDEAFARACTDTRWRLSESGLEVESGEW